MFRVNGQVFSTWENCSLDHQGQCDCACVSFGVRNPCGTGEQAILGFEKIASVERILLDLSYCLLFNPLLGSGVTVLDAEALTFLDGLPSRLRISQVDEKTRDVLSHLVTAGILKPTDTRVTSGCEASRELTVFLSVTDACNIACDYCYINERYGCITDQVGRKSVDTIVDMASLHGYDSVKLKFAGGEPTLVLSQVLALHDYAVTYGMNRGVKVHSMLLSNGVHFEDAMIAEIRARDIRVAISLDGLGQFHNTQRKFPDGSGTFAYVDRTIEKLIATRITPIINITISNRNAAGLADITQYVVDRKLPFSYNFFRENPRTTNFPDLEVQNERLVHALLKAFEVVAASPPDHSFPLVMVDCCFMAYPHHQACSAGDSYFAIDPRGNIAKCPMLLGSPVTHIYADDPLSDLQNDQTTLQQLDVKNKEECRECKWRYWCAGGCPLLTYRTTERYDTKSPYCEVYKAVFPELLRLEGIRIMKREGIL